MKKQIVFFAKRPKVLPSDRLGKILLRICIINDCFLGVNEFEPYRISLNSIDETGDCFRVQKKYGEDLHSPW